MFGRYTGAGTAPPQLMPSTGGHVLDEKSALAHSEREARFLSTGSSSTMSRFVERLEASVYSLSSLRTIPSWRSTLSRAHKTYAKIECGHDGDSDTTPCPPHESGGASSSSQRSSFGNSLWNNSLRRRRQGKRARSPNNVFHTSLSDILARFSHAMSNSTGGHHDPGTTSSSSSLGAHPSSSLNSHVPFPTTSEESSSSTASYPSPYSADAVAAFQAPRLDKGDVRDAPYFDGRVRCRGIFEDHIQVDFAEAADGTSTSTSTSATSVRATSKPRRLLAPLRRRVSAVARSVTPTRRKFPTIFHKDRRPPRSVVDDDDDDPVEYDIPCLAYITCLW